MIVYSWKQYWNDFNNWDEGLFQDANRPRDDDKFKLRPWLQSDKWDWRETTKNRDAVTLSAYGFRQVSNTTYTWWSYDFYRIRLQDKFTDSDLSDFNWYQQRTRSWTASELRQELEDAKATWNPKTKVTDGYIEILETWTYWINCFAQFFRPNGHQRYSNAAMWVWLWQVIDWEFKTIWYNMSRSCTDIDALQYFQIDYFRQGTLLAPAACEWYWNVLVLGGMYATRIW